MIKTVLQLAGLGLAALVLLFFLAPRFVSGAGNALINSINGSSAHGIAQLVPDSQGKNTILQVKVDGLSPNTQYDVSLNRDQCSGQLVQEIGTVKADTNGTATTQKSVANLSNINQHTMWLDIHQGSSTLACGQVEVNGQSLTGVNTSQTPTGLSQQVPTSPKSQSVTPPAGVSNTGTGTDPNSDVTANPRQRRNVPSGFGQTGVAPGESDKYDNYTFPRKY